METCLTGGLVKCDRLVLVGTGKCIYTIIEDDIQVKFAAGHYCINTNHHLMSDE